MTKLTIALDDLERRWQQMEREADADIVSGRIEVFSDISVALQSLETASNDEQNTPRI